MRALPLLLILWCAACSQRVDLGAVGRRVQHQIEAGELERALSDAQLGRAEAHSRGDLRAEWGFRLQQADAYLIRSNVEAASSALSSDMPADPAWAELSAQRLMLLSRTVKGDESTAILERAWQTAEAAGAQSVLAQIESMRGLRLYAQQRYPESDAVLVPARQRAHSAGSAYLEAGIVLNLGLNQLRRDRYDAAAGYFEEASRIAGPERTLVYSAAQQNLAICYAQLGDLDRSMAILAKSIEINERARADGPLADAVGELGREWLSRREFRKAAPYMERALALSRKVNNERNAAVWASNLSMVYRQLGELDRAEAFNRESMDLRQGQKLSLRFNHLNAGWIAVERGDRAAAEREFAEATREGEAEIRWETEEAMGRLALRENRADEALRRFENSVAEVERARSSLSRTEFKLPFLTRLIGLYRVYVQSLLNKGEIERALAVADSSRAQVLAQRSGAGLVRRLPPGAFREMARSSHAILLSYWLGPDRSHAWVVTPAEVHHVELPAAGQIDALVQAYQEAVERQLADPARSQLPAGERLFATLVEPVRQWIPPGSHVMVTPDSGLHGLNLESLPVPGTSRYWVEDVTLSVAPALSLLDSRPRPAGASRLLVIGDPEATDEAYPKLHYAAGEIATVRKQFPAAEAVVMDGARATPAAWRGSSPGTFSGIHFAAHALANAESPLDSAVLLAGGKLYAREVMATPLTADLVTVSACRGVGTRLYSGEGLVGFAWAFLHAGARNVIAGLWDVNDQSTSQLMEVLYHELAAGRSPADALHAAKLTLATSRGNLRKPYYWAPFQLYTVAPR